ncbi:diflavin flavoprotein [Roseofilum casamattae]|uniref:Diflavin flavoprotein n=1 Tax=Roseofilum casamattae BLCC-M143 TaxID=3022442 RepID=A0ABT7BVW3_9CYAN|nr:diflavin flavoprotein [Roseofilum casamattae]MDJ1183330.1 diflavin flavoprotein [Roseofilum casamattae BLCC-M143]
MAPLTKPRDVQVVYLDNDTTLLRSRTWDRLKFEVEYSLQKGTTANSFLIKGDKIALIDPPGESFSQNYIQALQERLDLKSLDYIIVQHFNPNRAATLKALVALAPHVTIVCSKAAKLAMDKLWNEEPIAANIQIINRGDLDLDLGSGHNLQFTLTPTPRWPDGICTYDPKSQILWTDKFFGAHVCGDQVFDEGWKFYSEDRRYYYDCVHAAQPQQVLSALKRLQDKPARFYSPAHGPLLRYGKQELTQLYHQWSEKQNRQELSVALIYASAYGNTGTLAQAIARGITKAGVAVELIDCEQVDPSDIQARVEKCDGFILGSPTLAGHPPTQVQTALGIVMSTAAKTKLAGVFGSFGWSGEAIDILESKLRDAGYNFGFEPIRVKFAPTDAIIQECKEAGIDFAQKLKKNLKRRTPKRSVNVSSSDRTAQAVGRVVGSLCIVSAHRGELHSAMLASWVSQATFNPPGITVAVAKDRAMESVTHTGDKFVLNILPENSSLARQFTKTFAPGEDRFVGVETETASNGGKILTGALAYLECTVRDRLECGDHWMVYATVESGQLFDPSGVTAVHHRKTGSYY